MAIIFGGIPLLLLLAVTIGLNVSARDLERRLDALVRDQLDRVKRVEHALHHLKDEPSAPQPQATTV